MTLFREKVIHVFYTIQSVNVVSNEEKICRNNRYSLPKG